MDPKLNINILGKTEIVQCILGIMELKQKSETEGEKVSKYLKIKLHHLKPPVNPLERLGWGGKQSKL